MRPINVEAAAQAFWGMLFSHSLMHDVYADQVGSSMGLEEMVEHFVDLFMRGTVR